MNSGRPFMWTAVVAVKGRLLRYIAYAHFLLSIEDACTFYPGRDCAVEKTINIRSFMETSEGKTRQWGSDHYREVSQNF